MKEIWKSVPGYEEYYEVSNTGKVRSLTRTVIMKDGKPRPIKGRELKPKINNGYPTVNLSKDGIVKTIRIHVLVAKTFIPNPNNLPIVNHKDENKQNNNVNNLEWCTYQYNNNYGNNAPCNSKKKSIAMCDINTHEVIQIFNSIAEANLFLGKDSTSGSIGQAIRGIKQKTAYGYFWKIADSN